MIKFIVIGKASSFYTFLAVSICEHKTLWIWYAKDNTEQFIKSDIIALTHGAIQHALYRYTGGER